MNKYTRLLSNTLLFAISTFSSKVLVFLLMPFYTEILPPDAKTAADLILKTGNMLLPVVSLGISNSVIRFGLDKTCRKESVYTNGIIAICIGILLVVGFAPFFLMIEDLRPHLPLMYLFIIVSVLRNAVSSNFVRSQMYTRLYAVDGLLNSALYVFFMILFLRPLGWGVDGFVLATVAADFCSMLFLTAVAGLHRYFRPRFFDKKLFFQMLRYAAPLIPSTMFWWIINTSDFYFVKYMKGDWIAGLYSTAYTIPNIIMMLSTLFTEAWQLSAVTEETRNKQARAKFFSRVFFCFQGLVFSVSAVLILLCKVCIRVLTADTYYAAWRYVPLLVIAMTYSCFAAFMGSIYMVEKRSSLSLYTVLTGAAANLLLNALFIPSMGAEGAAIATALSFLLVFLLRILTTKKYIRMRFSSLRMLLNTVFLITETILITAEIPLWWMWAGLVCLATLAFNFSALWQSAKKLLHRGK